MLSLLPSDPRFHKVNKVVIRLAWITNNHVHFDTRNMDEFQRAVELAALENALRELVLMKEDDSLDIPNIFLG